ncbi:transglycosylase domain-containing protein [Arthrobacter sp. NicSoilB8]|uniref:transglycosylase domain-containing protein n=1 Tax=Arthrobacter sp. NicSoilB8 TaxID=2830998 RepID=UPI001CC444C3|nr:transglycosylase domain-containing protein [Arthrobacter sp. NicSoilB8]
MRRLLARILKLALAMVVATELATVSFIWFTPPRTAYMLENGGPIAYQYVSLDHISRYVIASAVAHEDQQLGTRVGAFSLDDFRDRAVAYLQGKDDPSGSTVPQQLVKNIFLWPEPNALRKGLEAGLATEFSLTLTHQRIMELYLNYAQFGPKLYGICAASWYYFDEAPWNMSEHQAAQLMGVLPLPTLVTRAAEGGIYLGPGVHPKVWDYVNGAANVWVPRQLEVLGGWKAAVATIGISDTASDHAAERGPASPDGCSSYPESVLDLLRQQGIALDRNGNPAPLRG